MHPEGYEKLPEGLTTDLYCTACERDMRIPLLNNIPITEKCLICGTPFDSPDLDASVPYRSANREEARCSFLPNWTH